LTALLLVGGLSLRMGRDKATLLLSGKPLWFRQLALLRELQSAAIWISARETPPWVPLDIEVVLDTTPSRGPLSGIVAALNRTQTSHLLVLAVDLPRMTSEHLLKLASVTTPGCGVVPSHEKHLEPLTAIYPKEAASLAQHALESPDVSMHSFARKLLEQRLLKEYPLAREEADLYLNVNTRRDLPL
jgi:molybdopterin-guanine dinucleotide biosynthesis protein A